jgi:hypothetical protein
MGPLAAAPLTVRARPSIESVIVCTQTHEDDE